MKRTTVTLPDDVDAELRRKAHECGVTVAELTRAAIVWYLGPTARFAPRPLYGGRTWRGRPYQGSHDIASRIDEILESEYSDHLMRESGLRDSP